MTGVLGREEILKKVQAIRRHPMPFLRHVKTQDQVDAENPIKPFPVDREYVRLYVDIWLRERLLAVPKSRRMLMSWTNVALLLWDIMWHKGRAVAIVSKKEEDADELVQRARFMAQNFKVPGIPQELIPQVRYKYGRLDVPQMDSYMRAFPQGADQLRQFTFSRIMADEAAFWEHAQKTYASAKPTLDGGGQFVAVSSPAPGFFKKIVFDQFDAGAGV